MIQQIIFTLLVIAAFYIAGKRFIAIYQSIKLGKPEDLSDHKNIRMKKMVVLPTWLRSQHKSRHNFGFQGVNFGKFCQFSTIYLHYAL